MNTPGSRQTPSPPEQFHEQTSSTNPSQSNNQQVAIDIPMDHAVDHPGTSTGEHGGENTNQPNDEEAAAATDNDGLGINIEINGHNLSQDDISTTLANLRQLLQQADIRPLMPESHVLNLIIQLLLVAALLSVRLITNNFSNIVYFLIRMTYVMDFIAFKLKREARLEKIMLRILGRNAILYFLFDEQVFYKVLSFKPVGTQSLTYLIFAITMADFMVQELLLMITLLITTILKPKLKRRQRRDLIKMMENAFLLYISALPVIQWYTYFDNMWLFVPYVVLKVVIYGYLCRHALLAFWQFVNVIQIGSTPPKSETDGLSCPVCYGEPVERPTKILCGHIFCENCLKSWLEQKNECPLCRQTVLENYQPFKSVPLFPPYLF